LITAILVPGVVAQLFYPIVEVVIDGIGVTGAEHHAVVTVTNYGSVPATNLTLFIKSPSKLVSVTNQFSTANVTIT
jgi:hypothetical protein